MNTENNPVYPVNSEKYVAIFSNTFWSIYNFRRSLIQALQEQGWHVVAISADDSYRQSLESMGCDTIVLKNLDAKSTSLVKEAKLLFEVKEIFNKLPCQLVYTFTIKPNLYTCLTSFFSRRKIVMTINGLGNAFSGNSSMRLLSLQLFRAAFAKAHRIVFQNGDDFRFFQQKIGLNKDKVLFVRGSGVNTNEFTFSGKPAPKGKNLIFLLACRLLKEKGVHEYIEAARRVKKDFPKAKFRLIGMPANNQSAIDATTLRPFHEQGIIELMPQSDDMNSVLEETDVMVLPSYYNEGVPRTLLESLSKGLPIITTNSVGCKETVIDQRNGYLIEPKNIDALEQAIRRMIQLPIAERVKMQHESRRLAEAEFNETRVVAAYINILQPSNAQLSLTQA